MNEEFEEVTGDEEAFRDRIATVNEDGKRNWIFPKKPSGKYFTKRKIVSYVLLIMLFGAPHLKINGEQSILFNIIERKFVLLGKTFWPQDLYLFAIAMIIGVVFVILFTIIFGRLFCGWVCPQTIFMEMVFRRIEYWIEGDWTHQKKLKNAPWTRDKIFKKMFKHFIFWIISFLIANTFLSYIIGADELWNIQTGVLSEHIGGLIALIIFTTVFYLVFTQLREQVCTTICPYGRLQGVLLDENTLNVAYDHKRGEGRAKFKKSEDRAAASKGDCIDCNQCVNVCPTGIDIRNGTQLECVNCTACIDACDHIMDGVGMDKGLIRFVSENGIKNGTPFKWTRRVKSYTALLILMLGILVALLVTRNDFESKIFRQRGSTFQIMNNGDVSNIFQISITNKTQNNYKVTLKLEGKKGEIEMVSKSIRLKKESRLTERFIIKLPMDEIENGERIFYVRVLGNGKEIQRVKAKFIGPML
ncbi:MAG: cytochrome c oxidase accessory protein FixG [Crocinitomicaceae bacterium]|jgi:cytochrome c oxidase accessory protein FixG